MLEQSVQDVQGGWLVLPVQSDSFSPRGGKPIAGRTDCSRKKHDAINTIQLTKAIAVHWGQEGGPAQRAMGLKACILPGYQPAFNAMLAEVVATASCNKHDKKSSSNFTPG